MAILDLSFFGFNLLDAGLILFATLFALGGYRAGLIARLSGWIGLISGVMVSIWAVPLVLGLFDGGSALIRFVVALVILSITVAVLSAVFQRIGLGLVRVIRDTPLQAVDRVAGGIAAVAVLAIIAWLLVPAAAHVPGLISSQVRTSAVLSTVEHLTPRPPDALAALGQLVDNTRFPDVFDDLRPAPDTGPPPEDVPVSPEVIERVTESTVRVSSSGCGRRYVGSGWAVGQGLIVTNAHVVAGADEVTVQRPDGEVRSARIVKFDDQRDLAVLEVEDLGQKPLLLGTVVIDADGASIGYPGGQQEPRVAAVSIRDERTTSGSDIYRESSVEREVVFLAARLQQGDSGSPVVDAAGDVVGIVFAISPDRATTAYALAPSELEAVLEGPQAQGSGRCL